MTASRFPAPRALRSPAPLFGAACALLTLVFALTAGCSRGPKPAAGPGAASGPGAAGGPRVWRPAAPDTLGPTVAVVGGRRITRHEVDSVITTLPAQVQERYREPEGYKDLVERMMAQEVFRDAASRAGIERDSVYQAELRRTATDLMIRRYYERQLQSLPPISDAAARAHYDEHPEEFTIAARARVRHIVVATRSKALEVRRALQRGAPWDATCARYSTDKATRENGGLVGWVAKDTDLVPGIGKAPAIVAAAYALPLDRVSEPLKSEKSWHLIRVEAREEKTLQPFETVVERLRLRLAQSRREDYGKTLTDSLLKYSSATLFEDSIRVAVTPAKTPADLFQEAQAAATPLQRIELYRTLIQRFPEERVSIQARFMIGFTYAEELREYDMARKEFEEFLRIHPDADLAGSAKWMLENMEKGAPDLEEEEEKPEGSSQPQSTESGNSGSSEGSK